MDPGAKGGSWRYHGQSKMVWDRGGVLGDVQQFRGGLVFKAHRRVYHSTLGLRVIKKKKKLEEDPLEDFRRVGRPQEEDGDVMASPKWCGVGVLSLFFFFITLQPRDG